MIANLRSLISGLRDDINDGIQWIVFYKVGISWKFYTVYIGTDDYDNGYTLYPEDLDELKQIVTADHKSISINGY